MWCKQCFNALCLLCWSVLFPCASVSCPAAVVQEKATRGALKSAVERAISKKTIVILDSLNNIKVWQYFTIKCGVQDVTG